MTGAQAARKLTAPRPAAYAWACLIALLVLALAGALQSSRGLWQDESTLLANLGLPLQAYFGSLPFYDQAAPPFALLTLDGAYALAGQSVQATRLILLGLNLALLGGLALVANRRSDRAALLAIAMMAVTPLAIRYCLELKQYGFEMQASLLFLLALRWLPQRPAAVMALAGMLSFVSFSIMLVVGVAVLDAALLRHRGALRWRWLGLLALYTLGWIACYLLLFRPATALQTANYPAAYQRLAMAEYVQHPGLLLAQFEVIGRAQAALALICALAATAVLFVLGKGLTSPRLSFAAPVWQPLRLLAGLIAIVAVLWLARLYPVSTNKQFLFTMPIGALLVAELFVLAADRVRASAALPLALALTLVPSAANALVRDWRRDTDIQDTRGLYAFIKAHPDALVLPDILFEPTLRHYAAHDPRPPRRIDALLRAESRPMESPVEVARPLSTGSPVLSQHVWERLDAMHGYPAYSDWVVRHAKGRGPALIAATYLGPERERIYAEAARRHGCRMGVAYRSREVVALRLQCP
ncbi:hypothetical protein [Novosphingobium sp. 9U]|uniref:hypothetical protein n=1 Tax=Novosphingobium sp. 9U TaxID=2653158 RepID=UPI0012F0EB02|nr:hypothetical protein [Novosphingobium sp. 9U]VWX53022.1 conserved membrane hypothetical protein [Novosphingobium sp. 9U]